MKKSKYCIGVDLGGTNIAIGLVDLESKRILKQHSVKTNAPRPCEAISQDIAAICRKLCALEGISMRDLSWIGVAAPGIVKDGLVVSAVNLGWINEPFGKILAEITGVPSHLSNDANAAAYAEALWGSGAGASSLIAFTLGTGVGGGIVFNGRIWEGINGFAAEMGHMIIERNGRKCACGKKGCIEGYCSATALVRDTKAAMQNHPESSMWKIVNGNIERVNGKTAFSAALDGDETAKMVINDFIEHLAIGVSNAINIFQPDVVCIGGGISREGEVLLSPLRERVREMSFSTEGARCRLVAATFRNDAGIIGAALLGLQQRSL